MPGTKASGRPGGNPDIAKHGFKTKRSEPLRENLQVRVTTSMMSQLKSIDNWHEFVRQTLAVALTERQKQLQSSAASVSEKKQKD